MNYTNIFEIHKKLRQFWLYFFLIR